MDRQLTSIVPAAARLMQEEELDALGAIFDEVYTHHTKAPLIINVKNQSIIGCL